MPFNPTPQLANQMASLLHKMAGDPRTRDQTLKSAQLLDPNYRMAPDVQIKNLKAELKAEALAEKQEEQKQRRIRNLQGQRKKLIEEEGYDEDSIKDMENTVMKKYPNLDYADAAKLYSSGEGGARVNQRPNPQGSMFGENWTFPSIPGLLENADKASRDMAKIVIDEIAMARR